MDATPTLTGKTTACRELSAAEKEEMYALFAACFEKTTPQLFERDLSNKDWVIRLRDTAGILRGFSTFALYETDSPQGQRITVVVSGDTIIQPEFWGTPELPRSWIRSVIDLSAGMAQPVYWLLISSGYKTYRFLPVFYREFYPRHDRVTPPELQALIDQLAADRFGENYHAAAGLVRFADGATPLREGIAEIDPDRLRNPHIAFFLARNPGHLYGDELVCLTRIAEDNFTSAGLRVLR